MAAERARALSCLLISLPTRFLLPHSPLPCTPSSLLSARIAFILACLMTNNSIWSANNNNNRNNNGKRKRKQGKLQAAYQVAHLVASATPTHALCPLKCSCNLIRFSTCPSPLHLCPPDTTLLARGKWKIENNNLLLAFVAVAVAFVIVYYLCISECFVYCPQLPRA